MRPAPKASIARSLTAVLAALILTACTKIGTSSEAGGRHPYTHPHELRFASASDIESLNPLVSATGVEMYLAHLCMAYLIKSDAHGDPTVPELVTEVPSQSNGGISQDGKTIIWHLRHGVKWSDGAPFDADDVVFSTKQVLNPANNAASLDGWDLITKIDEPDEYTVVYRLKKPYSSFAVTFFSTGDANPAVMPAHLLRGLPNLNGAPYNSLPVGIGPFKYQAWKRGDSVVMVRDPNYFRGRAKLDRIVFKVIPDRNTTLAQLRTHEIDLWIPITPHFYRQALAIPGIVGTSVPSYVFDHIDFNTSHAVVQDKLVREALRFATNRQEIVDKVRDGLYAQTESPVAIHSPYYLDLPRVPFDIAKANLLLEGDGWKRGPDGVRAKAGRRLSLTFASTLGAPDNDIEIELIRGWWSRLGVDLVVKRYQQPQLFATAANGGIIYGGKFDAVMFGWGTDSSEDLSNFYACYRFPPDGQNDLRWCDRAATAQVDRAKESYDPAVRKGAIDALQRALYDQVPTIILDNRVQTSAYSDDLKNWHTTNSPFDDMMNVDI
jgi:peptide/nickel transport system substrate-binding protein